jgi:hypothetical protein
MMIFGSQFTARVVSGDLDWRITQADFFKRRSFLHPVRGLTRHNALPYKLLPADDRLKLGLHLFKGTLYTSIPEYYYSNA